MSWTDYRVLWWWSGPGRRLGWGSTSPAGFGMFHTEFLTVVNNSNKYCQQQYLSLKMTEMYVFKECEGTAGAHQVHKLHQAASMSSPTWTMALEHGHTLQVVSGLKVWHKHHGQETIRSRNVGSELNSSRHFRVLAYRIPHFRLWNVQRPCVKLQK